MGSDPTDNNSYQYNLWGDFTILHQLLFAPGLDTTLELHLSYLSLSSYWLHMVLAKWDLEHQNTSRQFFFAPILLVLAQKIAMLFCFALLLLTCFDAWRMLLLVHCYLWWRLTATRSDLCWFPLFPTCESRFVSQPAKTNRFFRLCGPLMQLLENRQMV